MLSNDHRHILTKNQVPLNPFLLATDKLLNFKQPASDKWSKILLAVQLSGTIFVLLLRDIDIYLPLIQDHLLVGSFVFTLYHVYSLWITEPRCSNLLCKLLTDQEQNEVCFYSKLTTLPRNVMTTFPTTLKYKQLCCWVFACLSEGFVVSSDIQHVFYTISLPGSIEMLYYPSATRIKKKLLGKLYFDLKMLYTFFTVHVISVNKIKIKMFECRGPQNEE